MVNGGSTSALLSDAPFGKASCSLRLALRMLVASLTLMSPFWFIPVLCLCAPLFLAGAPDPASDSAGWKVLFDGRTLAGWRLLGKAEAPSRGWSVVAGALTLEKDGGRGDIVTVEEFDDFEFRFEWQIGAGANSGVKYNLPDPTKAVGCEYQLIDEEENPDSGRMHGTAGLYDVIAPAPDRILKPAGEWNEGRIIVRGDHVEHWLNGGKTAEFELGSAGLKELVGKSKFKNVGGFGIKARSPILLQDHGVAVAFRNMKIRAR